MSFIRRRNLTNLKIKSNIMYNRVIRGLTKINTRLIIHCKYIGAEYKNINKFNIRNKVLVSKYNILKTLYYNLIQNYPSLKDMYDRKQHFQIYTLYILKKREYI